MKDKIDNLLLYENSQNERDTHGSLLGIVELDYHGPLIHQVYAISHLVISQSLLLFHVFHRVVVLNDYSLVVALHVLQPLSPQILLKREIAAAWTIIVFQNL